MNIKDYLDVEKLEHHVKIGLVTARKHETLPLTIYSYGKKAVFDNVWDDVTCKTRGLIVDDLSGNVIARPYEKFFSYNTIGRTETYPRSVENIDKKYGPPIITEKINGCLGIYWEYEHHKGIATKGSFHSPHAEWANKWLEDHIKKYGPLVLPYDYTPVFEIICQDIQPHVIKYPKDELILLSLIYKETGEELAYGATIDYYAKINKLSCTPRIYKPLEKLLESDSDKIEGYVATYSIPNHPPFKLKIKFPTFLENRKKFYAEQTAARLKPESDIPNVKDAARKIVKAALVCCTTRKEFAEYFMRPEHKPYASMCFELINYDKVSDGKK